MCSCFDVHRLETLNCVNCSRRNPKRSAKYVYHTGTLASSIARAGNFLREGKGENQKFIKYTVDVLSIPDYVIKKGRPHGHRCGKKLGDRDYYIANQLKKCKKKYFQCIHDRFVRDDKFRRNMIEIGRTEDLCCQTDDLADEDHSHHLIPQEYYYYKKVIGGFVRTRQVPILCLCSTDLTSNKHCLPCSN